MPLDPPNPLLGLLMQTLGRRTPADALSTIPGQSQPGTQPGPQTFNYPGQNALQNLMLAAAEGSTVPLPNFGQPERFWDPRILGMLAGVAAVLEPGPGGEAKVAGSSFDIGKGLRLVEDAEAAKLLQGMPTLEGMTPLSFNVMDEAGNSLVGLEILHDAKSGTAVIDIADFSNRADPFGAFGESAMKNTLGPATIRRAGKRLIEAMQAKGLDVKSISGLRTSGATAPSRASRDVPISRFTKEPSQR